MTIDLKDLEAGDTVELRCGGRITISNAPVSSGDRYIVCFGGDAWSYESTGGWSGCYVDHNFDIVAIHKKPKPRMSVTYHPVWYNGIGNSYSSFEDAKEYGRSSSGYRKITLNHNTGEVTAEVVK